MRKMTQALGGNPDLIMSGLSGGAMPLFDMSASLGMGHLIPSFDKMMAVAKSPDPNWGKAGGEILAGLSPVGQAAWNVGQYIFSSNPNSWKAADKALPKVLKDISAGTRWLVKGNEISPRGNVIAPFSIDDPMQIVEALGKMAGFQSGRVSGIQEEQFRENQAHEYYRLRRGVLEQWYFYAHHVWNTQASQDAIRQEIDEYNDAVRAEGYGKLALTQMDLMSSSRAQAESMKQAGQGYRPGNRYRQLQQDYRGIFLPEEGGTGQDPGGDTGSAPY
jgi:hypothetical protein